MHDLVIAGGRLVATMDDDRRELDDGWVAATGGLITDVGSGSGTAGGAGPRRHRLPGHAGARQHPPPPVPEPHPRPPADDRQAAVRLAAVALPAVGGARHRGRLPVGLGRAGRAGAVGVHDLDGSPLPPPAPRRRPACRRDRRRHRPRGPLPPDPRLDVAVAEGRRPAARRRRRRRRRHPRRLRGGRHPHPRPLVRGDGADRPRPVLAVHRHRAADGPLGRAGRAPRRPPAHPLRRERRGRRLLAGAVRLPADRLPRAHRVAVRPGVARPLRDAERRRDRPAGGGRRSESPTARRAT